MTLQEFQASLGAEHPPAHLGGALEALWWDAKQDWDRAHECAQTDVGAAGCWVHAYLHRKEGDAGNAAYWYRRAARPMPTGAASDEWLAIADALLRGDQ